MIEPSNEQIRYAGSKILLYRARPAAREFHRSPAKNRWQFGGNRCLGGNQDVYDPVKGCLRRVDTIRDPWHVLAWDGHELVVAPAGIPYRKPPAWLLDVTLASGERLTCAGTHLVACPSGWRPIAQLRLGSVVCRPQTSATLITGLDVNRNDSVWDFEVPGYHNYLAAGVINHNSGKSESNIGFDLCSFALGLHPYRATPRGAVIWAAANTWELVGKLLWSEKIKSYLPLTQIAAIVWHNKAAGIPAELRLRNGTTIEFRAYEQGRKAFEGRAIDAFYGDEQCGSDSEGIWQEVQARLLDKQGFSAQSMTPILFQGWLEDRIKALPATDSVHYADLNDNRRSRGGYVADTEIDAMIAEWPADVQETRIRGHFAAFLGSVYKAFRRDVHVCDVELPPDAEHYRAIDFGFNNPFVCLWLARYGPHRRWHIYAEHYQAREGLAWHADRINARLGTFVATWADHDAQDVYELAQHGILTLPAKKDVRLGIELVQSRLQCDGSGRPGLTIAPCCENTIREMQAYRWSEGSGRTDPRDEPHKQHDHCPDSLRYCLYSVEGDSYFRR